MGIKFTTLMYGEPEEVATLVSENTLDDGELRAALSNALTRIATLEKAVVELSAQRSAS